VCVCEREREREKERDREIEEMTFHSFIHGLIPRRGSLTKHTSHAFSACVYVYTQVSLNGRCLYKTCTSN